jgi:hypothetical protein
MAVQDSEQWKPVPGYEGLYEVSDHGRVRSLDRRVVDSLGRARRIRGRVLRAGLTSVGYDSVALYICGQKRTALVHRLVLSAFAGPCPSGMEGCHDDGVRTNNRLENLRWDTHMANVADATRHGTQVRGERHGRTKLTEAQALEIRYSDESQRVVAERFGVSQQSVSDIRTGKRWAHIAPTGPEACLAAVRAMKGIK